MPCIRVQRVSQQGGFEQLLTDFKDRHTRELSNLLRVASKNSEQVTEQSAKTNLIQQSDLDVGQDPPILLTGEIVQQGLARILLGPIRILNLSRWILIHQTEEFDGL
jgi:hypothetical protein